MHTAIVLIGEYSTAIAVIVLRDIWSTVIVSNNAITVIVLKEDLEYFFYCAYRGISRYISV